ncbi:MAG: Demethylmenaquinone methyltransferase [Chlamydiia bacterium]|nr:Demethylmenaquinone methyltransferase [Chlamydiia bacterium]
MQTRDTSIKAPLSRENIQQLFNEVSSTYDILNTILSFGIDKYWRARIRPFLNKERSISLIDLATGTGDQLFTLLKKRRNIESAVGIDLSEGMLNIAKKKVRKFPFKDRVHFKCASALKIPYEESSFDALTMSFGIRNVTDIDFCFSEMIRILKPGGEAYILEFSLPKTRWFRSLYLFYLRNVLPKIGKLLSKNAKAYTYLNKTIESFPYGSSFCDRMLENGFTKAKAIPLTFGIATLYHGIKESN